MNYLYIDTSDNKKVIVCLEIDKQKFTKEKEVDARSAQLVLPLIHEILGEHGLEPKDLTGIKVHIGPGSFTGLRVGVSVANAFAFALHIPVNNLEIVEGKTLIEPMYS